MSKVKIKIEPWHLMEILIFLRCRFPYDQPVAYQYQGIKDALEELTEQAVQNLTDEHWDNIEQTEEIYKLIGKIPRG